MNAARQFRRLTVNRAGSVPRRAGDGGASQFLRGISCALPCCSHSRCSPRWPGPVPARPGGSRQGQGREFDKRMFAGPLGQKRPMPASCGLRCRASGAAPQAEGRRDEGSGPGGFAPEDKITNYSFRLGVKYRNRPGDFDSSGSCNHVTPRMPATKSASAAASIARAVASMSRCRRMTNQPSSASKEFASGRTTSRTTMPKRAGRRRRRQAFSARPRRSARMRLAGDRPQGTRGTQAQVIGM